MNRINSLNVRLASNDMEFIAREVFIRLKKLTIVKYLRKSGNKEYQKIADYIISNGVSVFPYEYTKEYNLKDVCAYKDDESNLICIKDGNLRMYLKRTYSSLFRAKRYYNNIRIEQDARSPHKYITDSFRPQKGDIIIDVGGAEGFFGLPYVDIVKKIYIFECDTNWIESLKYTYRDYMDKVFIIPKYVSDCSDASHIRLDDFITEEGLENDNIFMKIDAEGSEPLIISGGYRWLETMPKVRISLCVYHSQNHEKYFKGVFKDWSIGVSDGYMMYYYDYDFTEPYLRRGVLYISNPNLI